MGVCNCVSDAAGSVNFGDIVQIVMADAAGSVIAFSLLVAYDLTIAINLGVAVAVASVDHAISSDKI